MKKVFLLLAVSSLSIAAVAQKMSDDKMSTEPKVNKNGWARSFNMYIGLTQVGNNSWYTTGGDKFALSASGELNVAASKSWKNKKFMSSLDAAYGLMNTTSDGPTKLNDRLELSARYLIKPKSWKKMSVGPYVGLRTQFTDGYMYNYMGEQGVKRRKSGFFAPAFITGSIIGVQVEPCKNFSVYVSPLTARWTVITNAAYSYLGQGGVYKGVAENTLASLYNVSAAKEHKGEFGLYGNIAFKKTLMKNIMLDSKLEVFGNYLNSYTDILPSHFVNFDMFMTNKVSFHVNKYIKVMYSLDLLYDDDMKQPNQSSIILPNRSVGLQALSTLGVGFTAKF